MRASTPYSPARCRERLGLRPDELVVTQERRPSRYLGAGDISGSIIISTFHDWTPASASPTPRGVPILGGDRSRWGGSFSGSSAAQPGDGLLGEQPVRRPPPVPDPRRATWWPGQIDPVKAGRSSSANGAFRAMRALAPSTVGTRRRAATLRMSAMTFTSGAGEGAIPTWGTARRARPWLRTSTARPSDSLCRVEIDEAVTAGCRVAGLVRAMPSRSRVVSRAARASIHVGIADEFLAVGEHEPGPIPAPRPPPRARPRAEESGNPCNQISMGRLPLRVAECAGERVEQRRDVVARDDRLHDA